MDLEDRPILDWFIDLRTTVDQAIFVVQACCESLFIHPSFQTLHATQGGKLKLYSDVNVFLLGCCMQSKFLLLLQLRGNVEIIPVPQTLCS